MKIEVEYGDNVEVKKEEVEDDCSQSWIDPSEMLSTEHDDVEVDKPTLTEKKPEFSADPEASTRHKQEGKKPPFTYAQLILQALMTEEDLALPLPKIYSFISQKYPFYKRGDEKWQNPIR